ncbi:hypothetical protein HYT25_02425 [Candidatus Pacearchaeota archaeon]|nr:hypothetical protein [Candidatus Pacearchaeota archaeon]
MFNPLKPFQRHDDKFFAFLLENDFSKDLEFITHLILISERDTEKIPMIEPLLDSLREKYSKENPSYKYASKNLRDEYDEISGKINRILRLDSLRMSHNPRSKVYQHAYRLLRKELSQINYN